MIRECFKNSTGIIFDACMLQEIGLPVKRKLPSDECYLAPSYPDAQPAATLEGPETIQSTQSTLGALSSLVSRLLYGQNRSTPVPDLHAWRDVLDDWEYLQDNRDALEPIQCPLNTNPLWWLFELVPISYETTMAEKLRSGDSYAMM